MKTKINLNEKNILITGSPGFIGANLVIRLLKELSGGLLVSVDNLNDHYDVGLKKYRLELIERASESSNVKHEFIKGDIADKNFIDDLFSQYKFQIVVNLAAQGGVRYSIENPGAYIASNITGFFNILEACRHNPVEHLVYASTTLQARLSMAETKKSLSALTIKSIIPSRSTQQRKKATSY